MTARYDPDGSPISARIQFFVICLIGHLAAAGMSSERATLRSELAAVRISNRNALFKTMLKDAHGNAPIVDAGWGLHGLQRPVVDVVFTEMSRAASRSLEKPVLSARRGQLRQIGTTERGRPRHTNKIVRTKGWKAAFGDIFARFMPVELQIRRIAVDPPLRRFPPSPR